jgi:7-cyano-7-deazaguanine synthase
MPPRDAVVLLSGGLDSATTLAIARQEEFRCHALTFDYGQRHRIELQAAEAVAQSLGVVEHRFIKIDLRAFGGSALTDDIDVPKAHGVHAAGLRGTAHQGEIPITYVPARNKIFLSFALAYAETRNAADVFIGVNAVDYSGYPDCRPEFISAFEHMANLGTKMGAEGRHITIHTPLIQLTKAQIIERGVALGVDYGLTISCYDPDAATGRPCGRCDSCLLRAAGFEAAGVRDPAQK